jgi:hypothetical protein
MSNLTVKPSGYCVVRQALNIDNDFPDHLVTGVFGPFKSFDDASDFIEDVADGPLRKMEHGFTDGEHYWNINGMRVPEHSYKKKKHLDPISTFALAMTDDQGTTYYFRVSFIEKVSSRIDMNKKLGPIPLVYSDMTLEKDLAYATDDVALLTAASEVLEASLDPKIRKSVKIKLQFIKDV